jgi:hypothetical protein
MNWQYHYKEWKQKLPFFSEKKLKLMDAIAQLPASKDYLLPEMVTVNEKIEEPREQKIKIRFDCYCEDECVFENFGEAHIRSLVGKFKRITDCTANNFVASGIIRDSIGQGSQHQAYNSLYLRVPPDVNIDESELPFNGRFFFFRAQDVVQVVSIETKHRNLN